MILNRRVAIYVPTTIDGNIPLDDATILHWRLKATKYFAQTFGGCSVTFGLGAWISPIHGLIEEKKIIVYSFTDDAGMKANLPGVQHFARHMLHELRQEAVSLEIDNSMELIYPYPEPAEVAAAA
jgi:hypothetical protein